MTIAYVINLKEREDRWKSIQERWKDTGLTLHRVDAIKMDDVYHAVFYKHRELLEEAHKRGDKYILIMEDDAVPCENFARRFADIQSFAHTKPHWDIINGGALSLRDPTYIFKLKTDYNQILMQCKLGIMAQFLYMRVDTCLEKLKKWEDDGKREFDAYYFQALNVFAAIPYLAIQEDGHSNAANHVREWSRRFAMEEVAILHSLREFVNYDGKEEPAPAD